MPTGTGAETFLHDWLKAIAAGWHSPTRADYIQCYISGDDTERKRLENELLRGFLMDKPSVGPIGGDQASNIIVAERPWIDRSGWCEANRVFDAKSSRLNSQIAHQLGRSSDQENPVGFVVDLLAQKYDLWAERVFAVVSETDRQAFMRWLSDLVGAWGLIAVKWSYRLRIRYRAIDCDAFMNRSRLALVERYEHWRACGLETAFSSAKAGTQELRRKIPENVSNCPKSKKATRELDRTIAEVDAACHSQLEVCRELDKREVPRPVLAKWASLSWTAAYKNSQYNGAVKKCISKAKRSAK